MYLDAYRNVKWRRAVLNLLLAWQVPRLPLVTPRDVQGARKAEKIAFHERARKCVYACLRNECKMQLIVKSSKNLKFTAMCCCRYFRRRGRAEISTQTDKHRETALAGKSHA